MPSGSTGAAGLLAAPEPRRGLVIVGQDVERRQALEPPRLACPPVAQSRAPASVEQVAARRRRDRGPTARDPVPEPGAARPGPDRARSEPTYRRPLRCWPAMELAGDDEAEMLRIVQVGLGGRLEQPPVAAVDRDDRLAERVDLVVRPELHQARDRLLQVSANERGIVLRIKGEGPVPIVGVLVIPLLGQLIALLP